MIRVLHVIPSLSPTQGGPSFALPLMARALSQAGVRVTVLSTNDDGRGKTTFDRLNHPMESEASTRLFFAKQTEFYKVSLPLRSWIRRNVGEFDLLHAHALFSFAPVMACRLARSASVPYVIRPLGVLNEYGRTHHRPGLKSWSFRLIERPLIEGAAAMHYTAEAERSEAESLGIRTRAAVIPLGIDTEPFTNLPPPDLFLHKVPQARGRPILLFLSRLDPKKGLDILLPAFAEARKRLPDAILVVAGAGEPAYTARLLQQAASCSLADSFCLPGFFGGDLKLSAFAAATAFVLPSYSENFGISVVEALAAGLPCIVSDQTAVSEDIRGGGAGIVVPCERGALTTAIVEILSNLKMRETLGEQARKLVKERFSLEIMGSRLKSLYEDILASPNRPPFSSIHA